MRVFLVGALVGASASNAGNAKKVLIKFKFEFSRNSFKLVAQSVRTFTSARSE